MPNPAMTCDKNLDFTGLKCPLPALLTKRALSKAAAGTTIEVCADDPLAYIDIPHMCRREGFEILSTERQGDHVCLIVRTSAAHQG